jgi:hypothetical protein
VAVSVEQGRTTIAHYDFETMHLTLRQPVGAQSGLSLGVESTGTVTTETYEKGALVSTDEAPFELTFLMRRATGDRWLTVAVLP